MKIQEYDKYDELHKEFWEAVSVLAAHELAEAKKRDVQDRAHLRGAAAAAAAAAEVAAAAAEASRGLHPDVENEIEIMLGGEGGANLAEVCEGGVNAGSSGGVVRVAPRCRH